jgi:putative transposase
LGTGDKDPAPTGPSGARAKRLGHRGDHRFAVGQDGAKRGRRGYDAGKKIKGRKRHILVDTLGLLLGVVVTPASCPERDGAQQVLERVGGWFTRLRKLWVDGGYSGDNFAQWVRDHWPKLEVEVVKRSDKVSGFAVLPRRWVVERTFGWLMRHRRLVRDYERTEASARSWVHLAMIRIQLRRLA